MQIDLHRAGLVEECRARTTPPRCRRPATPVASRMWRKSSFISEEKRSRLWQALALLLMLFCVAPELLISSAEADWLNDMQIWRDDTINVFEQPQGVGACAHTSSVQLLEQEGFPVSMQDVRSLISMVPPSAPVVDPVTGLVTAGGGVDPLTAGRLLQTFTRPGIPGVDPGAGTRVQAHVHLRGDEGFEENLQRLLGRLIRNRIPASIGVDYDPLPGGGFRGHRLTIPGGATEGIDLTSWGEPHLRIIDSATGCYAKPLRTVLPRIRSVTYVLPPGVVQRPRYGPMRGIPGLGPPRDEGGDGGLSRGRGTGPDGSENARRSTPPEEGGEFPGGTSPETPGGQAGGTKTRVPGELQPEEPIARTGGARSCPVLTPEQVAVRRAGMWLMAFQAGIKGAQDEIDAARAEGRDPSRVLAYLRAWKESTYGVAKGLHDLAKQKIDEGIDNLRNAAEADERAAERTDPRMPAFVRKLDAAFTDLNRKVDVVFEGLKAEAKMAYGASGLEGFIENTPPACREWINMIDAVDQETFAKEREKWHSADPAVNRARAHCDFYRAWDIATRLQLERYGRGEPIPEWLPRLLSELKKKAEAQRKVEALLQQAQATEDPTQKSALFRRASDAAEGVPCLLNRVVDLQKHAPGSISPPPTANTHSFCQPGEILVSCDYPTGQDRGKRFLNGFQFCDRDPYVAMNRDACGKDGGTFRVWPQTPLVSQGATQPHAQSRSFQSLPSAITPLIPVPPVTHINVYTPGSPSTPVVDHWDQPHGGTTIVDRWDPQSPAGHSVPATPRIDPIGRHEVPRTPIIDPLGHGPVPTTPAAPGSTWTKSGGSCKTQGGHTTCTDLAGKSCTSTSGFCVPGAPQAALPPPVLPPPRLPPPLGAKPQTPLTPATTTPPPPKITTLPPLHRRKSRHYHRPRCRHPHCRPLAPSRLRP
jgi:hypothetical protein